MRLASALFLSKEDIVVFSCTPPRVVKAVICVLAVKVFIPKNSIGLTGLILKWC